VEIPQVLQEFRRAKKAAEQRQTEEVQKILAMLQQPSKRFPAEATVR